MYKTAVANELVDYVTVIDGDLKFCKNNDWAENLGGSNGTLKAGGDNITVKKGTYLITADFNGLKIYHYPLQAVGYSWRCHIYRLGDKPT